VRGRERLRGGDEAEREEKKISSRKRKGREVGERTISNVAVAHNGFLHERKSDQHSL
jgi:hypothetical protein